MRAMTQAEQRLQRVREQRAKARDERAKLANGQVDAALLQQAADDEAAMQRALAEARAAVESAEQIECGRRGGSGHCA